MSPTSHPPGSFCWAELSTTDGPAAQAFYRHLMGWQMHDDPLPSGGVYTMLQHDGGNVGALYQQSDEMRQQGVPPSWLSYVTVVDAKATADRVAGLGGRVLQDAFDVMDIGRMAVLADPLGATFAIWQPQKHTGYAHTDGRPGTVCWHELATHDLDRAGAFYAGLFGWTPTASDAAPGYVELRQGDRPEAGMLLIQPEWGDVPPNWMVYFAVDDCDAALARAVERGAEELCPATDIPTVGRFATVRDPQGAVCSVIRLLKE